jgi:hypothetical protein
MTNLRAVVHSWSSGARPTGRHARHGIGVVATALSMMLLAAGLGLSADVGQSLVQSPSPAAAASCESQPTDPAEFIASFTMGLTKTALDVANVSGGSSAIGFISETVGRAVGSQPDNCAIKLLNEISTKLDKLKDQISNLEQTLSSQLAAVSYESSRNHINPIVSAIETAMRDLKNLANLKQTDQKYQTGNRTYESDANYYRTQLATQVTTHIRSNQFALPSALIGGTNANGLVRLWSAAVAAKNPLLTAKEYPTMNDELNWAKMVYAAQYLILINYYHQVDAPDITIEQAVNDYTANSKALDNRAIAPLPVATVLDTRQGRNLMWYAGYLPYAVQEGLRGDSTDAYAPINKEAPANFGAKVPAMTDGKRVPWTNWQLPSISQLETLVSGRNMDNAGNWLGAQSGNGGNRWVMLGWNNTDRFWSSTRSQQTSCFHSSTGYHLCKSFTSQLLNYSTGKAVSCTVYNQNQGGRCVGHVLMVRPISSSERYYWPLVPATS